MSDADPVGAAQNALFGVLAFQHGFIDRRAFLAACESWASDPSRPIASLLVDRGELVQDTLSLVEDLVTAHLSRRDEEPHTSLPDLTGPGASGDDHVAVAQFAMVSSLGSGPTDEDATEPPPSRPQAVGAPSSAGVRFQILHPLSKGGMGVVSVAHDTELNRAVALKEIREASADNEAYRARFLAEAEITGKLEHPGIIPIYGLGTYDDGRPFYAMRLIRGDKTGSLKDAIERFHTQPDPDPSARVVAFRALLGRFLDVCNALSYAHSKGVIHRDLKPENVLLGPYGETLVVDWGLAKAAGRADPMGGPASDPVRLRPSASNVSPTLAGWAFGTPEYAPPEQMRGDLTEIGPRSDVYGLGAVLYCLMTGGAPFSRKEIDLVELTRKIEAGEFPPPRQVLAHLDRPLEAICLKAMKPRPADRYASAAELAADIERYLADEPVTALRDPWTVRARRWTSKRRTIVSAAAAALLVAAVGMTAVVVVQTRSKHDLALKNADLERQRSRAEAGQDLAIDAVKRFHDAVVNEPGLMNTTELQGLRRRLLSEPLAFYRSLRARLQNDADARPEFLVRLARSSIDLGNLIGEIGNTRDALDVYLEAQAIYRKLAEAYPHLTEYQAGLASCDNHIAHQYRALGQLPQALEAHETARQIFQGLTQAYPAAVLYWGDLASTHNNIGLLLRVMGKHAEAVRSNEAALAILRTIPGSNPHSLIYRREQSVSYHNMGLSLRDLGKPVESLKAQEQGRAIRQAMVDADPGSVVARSDLAASDNAIGTLRSELGQADAAMEAFERSLRLREELARDYPAVLRYQIFVALSHNNIGNLLKRKGDLQKAMASHRKALEIREALALANPNQVELQRALAVSLDNTGAVLRAWGKPTEAMEYHDRARGIWRELGQEHLDMAEVRDYQARSDFHSALALADIGNTSAALDMLLSALALQRELVLACPESPHHASALGRTLAMIGLMDLAEGRLEPARDRLREAVNLQKRALGTNPANPTFRALLRSHLAHLMEATQALGDAENAVGAERELASLPATHREERDPDAPPAAVLAHRPTAPEGDDLQQPARPQKD